MEFPVWVVGIGPGHPDYILPAAVRAVEAACFLVGGPRALELFNHLNRESKLIDRNLPEVLEYIKDKRKQGPVAVLVSGDPGFYSLLGYLSKHFAPEDLRVIPGISSVQVAFSTLKLPWQDAALLSLHGRPLEDAAHLLGEYPAVGLLTDPKVSPAQLADCLANQGLHQAEVYICENLSYPDEQVCQVSPAGLREIPAFNNCVVVIRRGT
ncbi:MAG: precorrin-6y C5,15-methyltransferase (decarboxylating) subunit CbiE [Clostridia bacterium]|nr:precorrin-6y C5,15-methyltransferase (decarboxylating) subunit CbiE [Clostridia bacterium]